MVQEEQGGQVCKILPVDYVLRKPANCLKLLDLSQNNISYLEHQVGWLGDSLRKLILCDNNLKQLPGEISFLNPAIKLELRGNPLLVPLTVSLFFFYLMWIDPLIVSL